MASLASATATASAWRPAASAWRPSATAPATWCVVTSVRRPGRRRRWLVRRKFILEVWSVILKVVFSVFVVVVEVIAVVATSVRRSAAGESRTRGVERRRASGRGGSSRLPGGRAKLQKKRL